MARALSLYASLKTHAGPFRLYTLCWDEETVAALKNSKLDNVVVITPQQVEKFEPRLISVRPDRTKVEYYFTCGPAFMDLVLKFNKKINLLTYLDADLYFFSDPAPVFKEISKASVGIISHDFAPRFQYRKKNGIYNVGWVTFRKDKNGLACLKRWKEQCIEWCHTYIDGSRYADQKYLDAWPARFKGVRIIGHPGANLGPWNLGNRSLSVDNETLRVNKKPLIFYHFHGFRELRPGLYDLSLGPWGVRLNKILKNWIFVPYLEELNRHRMGYGFAQNNRLIQLGDGLIPLLKKAIHILLMFVTGSYIIYRPKSEPMPAIKSPSAHKTYSRKA